MIRFAKYVHFLFFSFLKHMAIFRSFFLLQEYLLLTGKKMDYFLKFDGEYGGFVSRCRDC